MQPSTPISAILATIFSGALAVGGMVWCIVHYATHSHQDLHSFLLILARQAAGITPNFTLTGEADVSVWLLMNSRVLELKAVTLSVSVESSDGGRLAEFEQNFRGITIRNQFGDSVYYRLGGFLPPAGGTFRIKFQRDGDWADSPAGSIVVRRSLPFTLPWQALLLFASGVLGLILSIRLLLGKA